MTQPTQTPRTTLALDLGTSTGWAIRGYDGLITSGTASFKPGRYDGGGMRYLRFTNWLTEIDRLSGPISTIWYEVCLGFVASPVGPVPAPPHPIAKGSMTVMIQKQPAARIGDVCAMGGTIILGEVTVLTGG
jgi:hypothetical protein